MWSERTPHPTPTLAALYEFLMCAPLKLQTINYEINRVSVIVVMVHRAAIQLDLTPANVLISYIIGVGGYFFLPLFKCHADPYGD